MCIFVHPASELVCVPQALLQERKCAHTHIQEWHQEKKHNNIHSRNTAHFLCFPPQSKAAAHLPSVWVLVSDKAVFFFFFCLQPAVIHHIWGLLLALYSTVAGADSTRPRLTDISLHPFPAAQPHNSSECKFVHIPCRGLAHSWSLADCARTFTKANLHFRDCIVWKKLTSCPNHARQQAASLTCRLDYVYYIYL